MKKIFSTLCFLTVVTFSYTQTKPPRLIIRGDDMGFSHSGNEALIKSYKEGIETSIEVLVPSPWFPEAVKLLELYPLVDVGIHLTLTSEWENIKWRPLTDCPSLKDANGYFFPMIFPNKNYPKQALTENKWNLAEVEKEFRAQIELAIQRIPRISHISGHMGCTGINADIKGIVKKLATEYHIDIDPQDYKVTSISYQGPHETPAEKKESFLMMLHSLQAGKTYLFVDHPGLNNEELRSIYHIGYENVAIDRQGVTDLFTNEKIIEVIRQKGIQLISYKQLSLKLN